MQFFTSLIINICIYVGKFEFNIDSMDWFKVALFGSFKNTIKILVFLIWKSTTAGPEWNDLMSIDQFNYMIQILYSNIMK